MTGSSKLTEEQQDWYGEKFGRRYVAVQEQPLRPSRCVRRGRPRDARDVRVRDRQFAAAALLREALVKPVL